MHDGLQYSMCVLHTQHAYSYICIICVCMYLISAKCVFISWFSVCKVGEEMEVGTQMGNTGIREGWWDREQGERRGRGGREEGRDGGRERGKERGREGGREGGSEGKEGGRGGGRERGREGVAKRGKMKRRRKVVRDGRREGVRDGRREGGNERESVE